MIFEVDDTTSEEEDGTYRKHECHDIDIDNVRSVDDQNYDTNTKNQQV